VTFILLYICRWRRRAAQLKVGRGFRAPREYVYWGEMAWPYRDIKRHVGGGLARQRQPMAYRQGQGSVVAQHGCAAHGGGEQQAKGREVDVHHIPCHPVSLSSSAQHRCRLMSARQGNLFSEIDLLKLITYSAWQKHARMRKRHTASCQIHHHMLWRLL